MSLDTESVFLARFRRFASDNSFLTTFVLKGGISALWNDLVPLGNACECGVLKVTLCSGDSFRFISLTTQGGVLGLLSSFVLVMALAAC